MVLNDLRLALGTRLRRHRGRRRSGIDRETRESAARAVYHWLTAVQDDLVTRADGAERAGAASVS